MNSIFKAYKVLFLKMMKFQQLILFYKKISCVIFIIIDNSDLFILEVSKIPMLEERIRSIKFRLQSEEIF